MPRIPVSCMVVFVLIGGTQQSAGAQEPEAPRHAVDAALQWMPVRTLAPARYSALLGVALRDVSGDSLRSLAAQIASVRMTTVPVPISRGQPDEGGLSCPMPIARPQRDVSRPMPVAPVDSTHVDKQVARIRGCTNPLAVP